MISVSRTIAARNFAAIFITLLLLLFGVNPAFAHARLTKSIPADKAKLTAAPKEIQFWFNELLDEGFNHVEIYSATELNSKNHTNLIKGEPAVDPTSHNRLTVTLQTLKPGNYIVDYRVLSRDGHTAPGRITFQLLETE